MSKTSPAGPSKARQWTSGLMLVCGIIGLIVSFILSVEKIHLLE